MSTIIKLQDPSGNELTCESTPEGYFFTAGEWEHRGWVTVSRDQAFEVVRAVLRSLNLQEPYITALWELVARHGATPGNLQGGDWEVLNDSAQDLAYGFLRELGAEEFIAIAEEIPRW